MTGFFVKNDEEACFLVNAGLALPSIQQIRKVQFSAFATLNATEEDAE